MNYNMQGMIYNGAFGTSGPMNPQGFNPYQNNIIPFGDYNQPTNQPQNTGLIFQPVGGYTQPSPYGAYVQQQQSNYYNPYGNTFKQSPYGNYSYSNYGGYTPYVSPVAIQQYQNQQVELFKIKYRLANHYVGNEINEDYLDKLCNPNNPIHQKTDEQRAIDENARFMMYLSRVANGIEQVPISQAQRQADVLNQISYNKHQALDHHSLCQFLEEDLWRLQREEWIRQHVKVNGSRDLSAVYNSSDYNELLKLHNGSSNPYIGDLLNNSRYDNNLDDIEMGMNIAFAKERNRKAVLEEKLSKYISSDEVQQRRHQWTQALLDQVYRKGSGG